MARPTTKEELLKAANDQFEKMWTLFDTFTEEQQKGSYEFEGKELHWKRDKNFRDVFVHLYEWHQLLLNWVANNQNGDEKPFLPAPYNWKTYGDMNVGFWEKHQQTLYEDSIKMVKKSHKDVIDMIEKFSDDELFKKGAFAWTGGSTLGQYCVSATSSHYDWAMKKMKKYKKEYC